LSARLVCCHHKNKILLWYKISAILLRLFFSSFYALIRFTALLLLRMAVVHSSVRMTFIKPHYSRISSQNEWSCMIYNHEQ